jgi:uncharacterized protein YacL (UPF0231 family)
VIYRHLIIRHWLTKSVNENLALAGEVDNNGNAIESRLGKYFLNNVKALDPLRKIL